MTRALLILAGMYAFAGLCWLVDRAFQPAGWFAKANRFVGTAVGIFATGVLFLVLIAVLFPQESAAVRNRRAIDSLRVRVESLEVRRP